MPAPKRKTTKKEDKDLQRAAQRAWMLDQKRNVDQAEEEAEEPVPMAEENKDGDIKDSEVDSGVEDNNDSIENEEEEKEEDGPLEDWTLKELKEECKTLGLADKGKKAELIERIKEARSAAAASEEETVIEKVAEEVNEEEPIKETEPSEAAVEENEPEAMEDKEDAPLEEWTVKELKDECKTLGVSDKGKKAELIERIKEAKSTVEDTTEAAVTEDAAVDEAPVEEEAVEEAADEEAAVEEAAVEEAVVVEASAEEAAVEEAAEEPAIEESAESGQEAMEVEEDGPLEEWTVKELKDECKTLGVADKGKKS